MQNLELKARYPDLQAGRRIALQCGARPVGLEHQRDTFFACPVGRLKLRQSSRTGATLIWYNRPDRPEARTCDYLLVAVADGPALAALLDRALGTRLVVEKQREVFLWENVRIHLDEVRGLGQFLEFEAVLGPDHSADDGRQKLVRLTEAFGIRPADCIDTSYADLLAGRP